MWQIQLDHKVRIEELRQAGKTNRAELITRHQLHDDVDCPWCGDRGVMLDTGAQCSCRHGDLYRHDLKRNQDWLSAIPVKYQNVKLSEHPNETTSASVSQWLASFNTNLILWGKVGRGKTGAAIAALRELHDAGITVAHWSMPDLLDDLRADEMGRNDTERSSRTTMATARTAGVLLLDDMGQERCTTFQAERLYVLINARYNAQRPTILTTNFDPQRLADHLGELNASRLRERLTIVHADGHDYRTATGR